MRMYSTVAHLRSSAVKERKETRGKTETVMVQVERVLVLFFLGSPPHVKDIRLGKKKEGADRNL